jgi:hypothetical protein
MTMLRTVTLVHGERTYTGRIRNVSSSGALIEGVQDVPAGTVFSVEFGGHYRVKGHCRWCREGRMGLEFDVAVSIDRIRAADKPAQTVTRSTPQQPERKRAAG